VADLTTLERLERGLSRVKKGWTQRVFARNAQGIAVPPYERDACKWCAVGALVFDQMDLIGSGALAVEAVKGELHKTKNSDWYVEYELLSVFNDVQTRKHEEIVWLYEATIARLKKEQEDGRDNATT